MDSLSQKSMNILYVAHVRMPTERAYGIQIAKTCEALSKSGTMVELLVPTRRNDIDADIFSYFNLGKTFTFTVLKSIDLVRFGSIGFLISALWFAIQVIRSSSFSSAEIVYSRDALVLFLLLISKKRIVFETHAPPSLVSVIVAKKVKKVVVISQGLRKAYIRAGVSDSSIVVAPDAVSADFFSGVPNKAGARRELSLDPKSFVALYAGHLYERKGAGLLAQAASSNQSITFLFVGGTKQDLASFRTAWAGLPNVLIIGHVAHEMIPLYLRAADLLVLPNSAKFDDSSTYTSPMKLFEYMASGTPIVAADVPAIREVLTEESAFFFPPDNSIELAKCITAVYHSPDGGRSRAQTAQALSTSFSWENRAHIILNSLE